MYVCMCVCMYVCVCVLYNYEYFPNGNACIFNLSKYVLDYNYVNVSIHIRRISISSSHSRLCTYAHSIRIRTTGVRRTNTNRLLDLFFAFRCGKWLKYFTTNIILVCRIIYAYTKHISEYFRITENVEEMFHLYC